MRIFDTLGPQLYVAYLRWIEQLPPVLLRKWHGRRLHELVAHAEHNIQMYRERLADIGVRARDIRIADDLERLPILTKNTFTGRPVEEVIDVSRPHGVWWNRTSGTSGKPFTFLPNQLSAATAFNDYMCTRFLYWGMSLQPLRNARIAKIKIRSGQRENKLFIPVKEFLSDTEKVYTALVEFKPTIIESYQSILGELARYMTDRRGAARLAVPHIISFGEMLSRPTRDRIEQALMGVVFDRYGVEEIGVIGTECAVHDGFHVHVESVIVEVVDAHGTRVPDGQNGKILATDLHNFNMPFIRYATGDRGYISRIPCACGLMTPRIWIEGRYASFIELGERRIHHLEFDGAMDGFMQYVHQYQIAKTGPREIVARIVSGSGFGEHSASDIERSLRAVVGGNVAIKVQTLASIPITPRGKTQILVDETMSGAG